ncbi:thioredoxin [Dietzia sp. NPDC055340]
MAATPNIVDVTETDFADSVLTASGSKPVLVDFWATWCRPCTMMAPVLDELAGAEADKLTVAKVDVEANQELAAEYQITAIPAMLLFSGGEVVKRITGAKSKSALRTELGDVLGS